MAALICDEAQDFSPLEVRLIRTWGRICALTVLLGDDDQALYAGLKGAEAQGFADFEGVGEDQVLVLSQSYRVPRRPHAFAVQIALGIAGRRERDYWPTAREGSVKTSPASWQELGALLPLLRRRAGAGQTVMVLAYAKYMLEPVLRLLREAALPFHNPWRPEYGAWNPLGSPGGTHSTAGERLLTFLGGTPGEADWTPAQLISWAKPLGVAGVFVRGGKDALIQACEDGGLTRAEPYFQPAAWAALLARDLEFYTGHVGKKAQSERLNFALELARQGLLGVTPQIVPGTVHSVKGAEAPCVVLFVDRPASVESDDEFLRTMYVGATRTSDELILPRAVEAGLPVLELHARAAAWLRERDGRAA